MPPLRGCDEVLAPYGHRAVRLIAVAVTRWRTGEDHQFAGQATGLDAGQVIR